MKKIFKYSIQIILILIIGTACSQNDEHKLIGTNWTSINLPLNCIDSLEFKTDSTLIWYCCEISWHFDAKYKMTKNSITVFIDQTHFELENNNDFKPTTKWILELKDSELVHSFIGRRNQNQFIEIDKETYKMIGNFKKIE